MVVGFSILVCTKHTYAHIYMHTHTHTHVTHMQMPLLHTHILAHTDAHTHTCTYPTLFSLFFQTHTHTHTHTHKHMFRIDCFADGQMGNINPELTYDGTSIRSPPLDQDWPLHVSYSYQRGFSVDRTGRYVCRTASGNNITHYLQTGNRIY